MSSRRLRAGLPFLAVAVVVGLLASGCSKGDGKALRRPGPGGSLTTTTSAPDLSAVQLSKVSPGKVTSSTLPPGPGQASIFGRVIDDYGRPVAGALVRASWYLPTPPQVIEALSGADGSYRFDQLRGGPWRIRAWLSPNLATLDAPSFFLGAKEAHAVDLKVKVVEEISITGRAAPEPPFLYSDTEVAVLVMSQSVDGNGKVARTPASGVLVALSVDGSWAFSGSGDPKYTDEQGTARWTMRCLAEGHQPITARAAGREVPLSLQPCLDPASTTTTAPPETTTSTTVKKAKSTTTTTRRAGSATTRGTVSPR